MPRWDQAELTDQQRRWFASVREGLERETGRSLAEWADLARSCPERRHRARLEWMKATYGLGQNRASLVLAEAFPDGSPVASAEEDPIWADPRAHAIFTAVERLAMGLADVKIGRRKGFTAFSRRYQFAALRPARGGVRLGLAVGPQADPRLCPAEREGWSERLHSALQLSDPSDVGGGVETLLRQAWERS